VTSSPIIASDVMAFMSADKAPAGTAGDPQTARQMKA